MLLAAACNDGRNHAALCAKGLPELLCEEMARMASPLLPVCVTATAALAAQQTNREALRTAGVVNALVLVLCNPAATHLRELVLRALAMLCTNSSAVAAELVRAGAISALANIVRQLLPNVAVQPDSPLLTNSLWTLATVSCSPESHLPILKEGLIDMLVAVLERAASTTYCDYALSCLLQLTANEACRQLMVTFKAHDVLVVRIACSFPSIVRRSLQVLANLCVDESSRATISSVPRLFETVITSSKRFAPELIAAGQADARSLLQCLKLLSNIIQTEHESNLFRAARGVQWLVNLATQYESAPADATIEQQLGHLIANTLIHCDNQDDWVSLSGVAVLKSMLAESKAMPVRREAARAVSNLVALHDELRDAVYNAGIVSSFISSLRKSLAEQNAASQLQLQLFTLRALATLALSRLWFFFFFPNSNVSTMCKTIPQIIEQQNSSEQEFWMLCQVWSSAQQLLEVIQTRFPEWLH